MKETDRLLEIVLSDASRTSKTIALTKLISMLMTIKFDDVSAIPNRAIITITGALCVLFVITGIFKPIE